MTQEDFAGLARLQKSRVEIRFTDGHAVAAILLSVSVDLDGSQHLVYETLEDAQAGKGKAFYTPGEEVLCCAPLEEV